MINAWLAAGRDRGTRFWQYNVGDGILFWSNGLEIGRRE